MRAYKEFDFREGYPGGNHLFYECTRCGEVLPSRPPDSAHCKCHNISIDIDYGRTVIEDQAKVKVFSEE